MGDHFVLLVDRLLTESTLGAAIESRNRYLEAMEPASDLKPAENTSHRVDLGNVSSMGQLVECRICQDEDDDRNMETPCSCCGSLKYAHRRCVQRWCNEKGNTLCEICHQQFKPGYIAPPPLFQFGRVPMNFRGNWEVYRGDLNGPRFITMVSPDRSFSDPAYSEHSHSVSRSLMCCRSVACIILNLPHFDAVHGSSDLKARSSGLAEWHWRILIVIINVAFFTDRGDCPANLHHNKGANCRPAPPASTGVAKFVVCFIRRRDRECQLNFVPPPTTSRVGISMVQKGAKQFLLCSK
ncbi:uncharacterized protein LOC115740040 isoform X2 [Rhodamnia argentea]|uniref:Uncharacterized protein LOC115740040 isoform X2 n=1 Tax=Rhodamnia argentea TaxID=178133 RepID=A0ABM3HE49_9MYRT|nr:uncharacterized protein LOC115740040 isoform X2 [Rhodamnia argentea]